MKTKNETLQLESPVSSIVDLATKVPVIAIVSSRYIDAKESAILISLGLKRHGYATYFSNFDEQTVFPPIVPHDENPDIIVINCSIAQINLLELFPEKHRVNVLVLKEEHRALKDSLVSLKHYKRNSLEVARFYCLGVGFSNETFATLLINNLHKVISRYLGPFSLSILGFVPSNQNNLTSCRNGYAENDFDRSLDHYEATILKLISLVSS